MALIDYVLDILTDENGDATVVGDSAINGFLVEIAWVDGTLADGVGAVISMTQTPEGVDKTLLTLTAANDDADYRIALARHDNAGAAIDGQYAVEPPIMGVPKVVVADGGNAKTGKVVFKYYK